MRNASIFVKELASPFRYRFPYSVCKLASCHGDGSRKSKVSRKRSLESVTHYVKSPSHILCFPKFSLSSIKAFTQSHPRFSRGSEPNIFGASTGKNRRPFNGLAHRPFRIRLYLCNPLTRISVVPRGKRNPTVLVTVCRVSVLAKKDVSETSSFEALYDKQPTVFSTGVFVFALRESYP